MIGIGIIKITTSSLNLPKSWINNCCPIPTRNLLATTHSPPQNVLFPKSVKIEYDIGPLAQVIDGMTDGRSNRAKLYTLLFFEAGV